ncbi:peroxidase-like [Schistocerca piceifrons]|uniref:peroxidase-like n=1 Tax=Schistocerca piceifrons TaxID=274613 RepID=UPI001F5E6060|nr:peroxidase-like [Schistocerca piceifrons]
MDILLPEKCNWTFVMADIDQPKLGADFQAKHALPMELHKSHLVHYTNGWVILGIQGHLPSHACPRVDNLSVPTWEDTIAMKESDLQMAQITSVDVTTTGSHCFNHKGNTQATTWNKKEQADPRTNQQPLRSAIHVLFLREHNRIAKILAKLNRHWKDEQLYQQARRILIAIFQHITYEEMLPILIGKHAFKEHFHAYKYNKKLCPGTFVEFTTVAFRYLHTIAHGILRLMTAGREINKELVLSDFYNRPTIVTKEFDEILIGAVSQECRKDDENFDKEIAHELFRANRTTFGLSLPAIDIQRARDHGVPSYNELRKLCGLPKALDFDDLSDTMSHTSIKKLRSAYKHVNDIDPLVGGTMEEGMPGAIMGPTFVCLVTKQFLLTQRSDRFFYLNRDQEQPFSPVSQH